MLCDKINGYASQRDPGCVWVKIAGGRDHTVLQADNGTLIIVFWS